MKMIWAVIRHRLKQRVEEALMAPELGISGLTCTTVHGLGHETRLLFQPHELAYCRVEVLVEDDQVDRVLQTLMDAAHTGVEGDGLVAVLPVERVYHIRTRKEGLNGTAMPGA